MFLLTFQDNIVFLGKEGDNFIKNNGIKRYEWDN